MLVHWLWLFYLFHRWENCSKYGSRAPKFQQKFQLLFVVRITAGEIPVFWLIALTETSFLSAKTVMYAWSSALKARVKTLRGKWIHRRSRLVTWIKKDIQVDFVVIASPVVTYFPLIIYFSVTCTKKIKKQIYVTALNAQNRLFKSNTILDKTTWENAFINAHCLTQQNYSQINGFA